MKNSKWHFFLLLVTVLLLQFSIFNHVGIGGFANPYIYLIFLLLLPIDVNGIFLLLSAFGLGFVMDVFSNSQGLHTTASLVLAFCRPGVLQLLLPRPDLDPGILPLPSTRGNAWVIIYVLIMVTIHHVLLYFLDVFHFATFLRTMFKAIVSSGATTLLILLTIYLIDKPSKVYR